MLRGSALLACIDEGVHHPELDILDVSRLEVAGVEFTHHTSPMALRVVERAVGREIGVEVIRASLVRIIRKAEGRYRRRSAVVRTLLAVRIKFAHIHFAQVVVRQLVEVALYVSWSERRRAAGEQRVNRIPC